MGEVRVHRWRRYDIVSDEHIVSRRYGTQEAIERVCGEMLPGTAVDVNESDLDPDFPGMTPRDFNPASRTGFQTAIRS